MGGASSRDQQSSTSPFFDQKELQGLRSAYEEGGLEKAASLIQKKIKDLEGIELNIAVTGESGTGKSSFINAIRGLQNVDEGAAKVGNIETTMEPTPYRHPTLPNVCFWDLPGVGTAKFTADKYLAKMNFKKYVFFIIIIHARFKENDAKLAGEIKRLGKDFYLVRSKIDNDLDSMKMGGMKFNEEEELGKIRDDCVSKLKEAGLSSPAIFLISSFKINQFDFPALQETIANNLNDIKKHAFMLSLPNTTVKIIDQKKNALKSKIWMLATISGAVGLVPIPGLSFSCDIGILVTAIIQFRQYLGLDDASLQRLANIARKPVGDLKAVVKTPLVGEINQDFVVRMLMGSVFVGISVAEAVFDFIPVFGSLFGAASSFGITYKLLNNVLDELTENAQRVVEAAFGTAPKH
ncbi:interferon-inducible GTPase 5-like [Scyliorhinus torazame]|uniref:interferon-inducible GTPase 5-like n=1 Tax=Scyliorhinus torazame TaxID=75743 RepID=UPI003B58F961